MASNSESPKYNKIESKKLGYGFTFVLIGLLVLVTGIIILSIEVITGAIVGIIIGFIIMSTSKITIPPNNTLYGNNFNQVIFSLVFCLIFLIENQE